ncbi:MAG: hypothetical protein AB8I08_11425 [Sandaracinaceae bacterium]
MNKKRRKMKPRRHRDSHRVCSEFRPGSSSLWVLDLTGPTGVQLDTEDWNALMYFTGLHAPRHECAIHLLTLATAETRLYFTAPNAKNEEGFGRALQTDLEGYLCARYGTDSWTARSSVSRTRTAKAAAEVMAEAWVSAEVHGGWAVPNQDDVMRDLGALG